jgi:hypothetical protein
MRSEPIRIQVPFFEELLGMLDIVSSLLILLGKGYRIFCLVSLQHIIDLGLRDVDRDIILAKQSLPWVFMAVILIKFFRGECVFDRV